jgi:hypothetical protein
MPSYIVGSCYWWEWTLAARLETLRLYETEYHAFVFEIFTYSVICRGSSTDISATKLRNNLSQFDTDIWLAVRCLATGYMNKFACPNKVTVLTICFFCALACRGVLFRMSAVLCKVCNNFLRVWDTCGFEQRVSKQANKEDAACRDYVHGYDVMWAVTLLSLHCDVIFRTLCTANTVGPRSHDWNTWQTFVNWCGNDVFY